MKKIFLSHSLEALAGCLSARLSPPLKSLQKKDLILVSHQEIKQWLFFQLARGKGIVMGLEVLTLSEWLARESRSPHPIELFGLIWEELGNHPSEQVRGYLGEKKERLADLTHHLLGLFLSYGREEPSLFVDQPRCWQQQILQDVLRRSSGRLPAQAFPSLEEETRPIHCFGVDFCPAFLWDYFFRCPHFSAYLFSPCRQYWDDAMSDREKRRHRRWLGKRMSLEEVELFLPDIPPLLSNHGKVGRENLKLLDGYLFDAQEVYPEVKGETVLAKAQRALLDLQELSSVSDSSLQIFSAGSSRLREVEWVRSQVLAAYQEGIAFEEMAIYVSSLDAYASLLEWIFQEKGATIPYQISASFPASRSLFYQGCLQLFSLGMGRWEKNDLLELVQNGAFLRQCGIDPRAFERWLDQVKIDWGWTRGEKQHTLSKALGKETQSLGERSWEEGLEELLQRLVLLDPEDSFQGSWTQFDSFLSFLEQLREDLSPLQAEQRTLEQWAVWVEELVTKYLAIDAQDPLDAAAQQLLWKELEHLKRASEKVQEPFFFSSFFPFLQNLTLSNPHRGALQAIRVGALQKGQILPARALFVLGLDEESLSSQQAGFSLDLRSKAALQENDRIRYCCLQAFFAAQERLCLSYRHLSAEDGKPLSPSSFVQDLTKWISSCPIRSSSRFPFEIEALKQGVHPQREYQAARAFYRGPKPIVPFQGVEVPCFHPPQANAVFDLKEFCRCARHSWQFYLEKNQGIFFNKAPLENFWALRKKTAQLALQTSWDSAARSLKKHWHGVIGQGIELEALDVHLAWQETLQCHGISDIFSLHLGRANKQQAELDLYRDPLEVSFENGISIQIEGDIPWICEQGVLCFEEDKIEGALKRWPEALVACVALQKPCLFFLKTGKVRQIEEPLKALRSWIAYFLLCSKHPSPLLPVWAPLLLRADCVDVEEALEAFENGFEDPIAQWVLQRADPHWLQELFQVWQSPVKEAFSELISLYTTGSRHAAL